jgi:cyanophycinase
MVLTSSSLTHPDGSAKLAAVVPRFNFAHGLEAPLRVSAFRLVGASLALGLAFTRSAVAAERLVIVGGGDRPKEAMSRFVEWAGGSEGCRILVISWATEEPKESFEYFREDLAVLKPAVIEPAPPRPLTASGKAVFLGQLSRATGVFFTGGDQSRIMEVLRDAELIGALRTRYKAGVVFGGTSAGAAIMSERMITGEGDFTVIDAAKVEIRPGLGLLPGVIVDQHFIKRQRENRLFSLILAHPEERGIGIDESTAILVEDGRKALVVGSSQVMLVDATEKDTLVLRLLRAGQTFEVPRTR